MRGMMRLALLGVPGAQGGASVPSLTDSLINTFGATEVWPLIDIESGTTIPAAVDTARSGTLSNWSLQHVDGPIAAEGKAPYVDGTGTSDLLTASLANAWTGGEFSLMICARVAEDTWPESGNRILLDFKGSTTDRVVLWRNQHTLQWRYQASSVQKNHNESYQFTPDWFMMGMSVSASADEVKFYLNDSQVGATATGLGAWTKALDYATLFTAGHESWKGWGAYLALKTGGIWTPEEFAAIHALLDPPAMPYFPGVWTWFNDPRGVRAGDKTFIGAITKTGDVQVAEYNHTTRRLSAPVTLHAALQVDDHDNPALMVRASDSRLMAFYTSHGGDFYMRVSTDPLDASAWQSEVDISATLPPGDYVYANPIQLTGEANQPIYVFHRGTTGFSKSSDDGATWTTTKYLRFPPGRLYSHVVRNGTDRIDICYSGHPSEYADSSIYHVYYQSGNLYKTDGTLLGSTWPIDATLGTLVWDGSGEDGNAWVWDIAVDENGYPIIVYAVFPTTADHRYRYARWTGSAWEDHEICTGGKYLYTTQANYSGGVVLDHENPNIVYASRETTPGVWNIFKYETENNGGAFAETQITSVVASNFKGIRPAVVRGHDGTHQLLFLAGGYNSYTNYDTKVVLRSV